LPIAEETIPRTVAYLTFSVPVGLVTPVGPLPPPLGEGLRSIVVGDTAGGTFDGGSFICAFVEAVAAGSVLTEGGQTR